MIDLSPMKGIHVDVQRANGARAGRRAVEGIESRDAAPWPGDDRRRRRKHGHRGAHAWRRPRMADAEVRTRARQPACRQSSCWPTGAWCAPAPTRHADLFWAIRGGGGNFGIATSLEYTLHQVGPDHHRRCVSPIRCRRPPTCCAFSATSARTLPDEMMLVAALQTAPDGSNAKTRSALSACHCGSLDAGRSGRRHRSRRLDRR